MNCHTLVILFQLFLLSNIAISKVIDTFEDPLDTISLIELGTDFKSISRSLTENISFEHEENRLAFSQSSNNKLRYNLFQQSSGLVDWFRLKETPLLHFQFSGIENHIQGRIKLADKDGNIRIINNINFNSNDMVIDLTQNYKELTNHHAHKNVQFLENNIKGIEIDFNCKDLNQTFYLDQIEIEAVPEPFTMITLGSGFIGLVRRKLNRKTIQL